MNIALSPALRRFVEEQVNTGRYLDAGDVVRAALRRMEAQSVSYALLGGLGDGDIMAQAFIVLMEAAKSAQEDLKSIMDGGRAINEAKARWRKVQEQVNRDAAANAGPTREDTALDFSNGMGSERAYHRVPLPRLDPDAPNGVRLVVIDLHPGERISVADLDAFANRIKSELDSLGDMGTLESLRLQAAMERRALLMTTLSNVLKKASDTASAITQNIK